jgi:hypothetical protein
MVRRMHSIEEIAVDCDRAQGLLGGHGVGKDDIQSGGVTVAFVSVSESRDGGSSPSSGPRGYLPYL